MQNSTFTDQLRRLISVPYPPKKIISLVPSQTELLFDLGLNAEVIGITKFCVHPHHKFISTPKIGGTKKLDLQKIRNLKPDLIIGNIEENEEAQIKELMKDFPVWMSDIKDLRSAIDMIRMLGLLTGKAEQADAIASDISKSFNDLYSKAESLKVAYFIWRDPYMLAGQNTFINDILSRAGFVNAIKISRYPELNASQILHCEPDLIFLSSEPYPFEEKHIPEIKKLFPGVRIILVDGELFSWYGSRLLQTPGYLQSLANN
jgi:ABC-type Fe3+-hydroxamate transport system substrate-binding protein